MQLGLPLTGAVNGGKDPGAGQLPQQTSGIWSATLDSSQLANIVEAMGEILAAAGGHELRFRLSVVGADGTDPKPDIRKQLLDALRTAVPES